MQFSGILFRVKGNIGKRQISDLDVYLSNIFLSVTQFICKKLNFQSKRVFFLVNVRHFKKEEIKHHAFLIMRIVGKFTYLIHRFRVPAHHFLNAYQI